MTNERMVTMRLREILTVFGMAVDDAEAFERGVEHVREDPRPFVTMLESWQLHMAAISERARLSPERWRTAYVIPPAVVVQASASPADERPKEPIGFRLR